MVRRKWRLQEPLDDAVEAEKPNPINKSIKMLVDEGGQIEGATFTRFTFSGLGH
jgi:hypothetical protein